MSLDLRGLTDASYNEATRTLRGMKLLRAMSKPGPEPGSHQWDERAFRQDLRNAFDKLEASEGRKPGRTQVADGMGIARSTFFNYLKDFKIPWPPG